ncbi:MAG: GxxExxY protein [Sedimentisphaerales bacterium]|nr:GxxExxY protein [Sedimentisphaerales bacterium]
MVKKVNLLYEELSYQIRGAAIEIRKQFGCGHKEVLYQRAFAEELSLRKIKYEQEKSIKVYSPKTRKVMGSYRPDLIVENKIIIELKALEQMPRRFIDQLYSYLRNSKYELGFLINFNSEGADIKRVIYTNDMKKQFQPKAESRC